MVLDVVNIQHIQAHNTHLETNAHSVQSHHAEVETCFSASCCVVSYQPKMSIHIAGVSLYGGCQNQMSTVYDITRHFSTF